VQSAEWLDARPPARRSAVLARKGPGIERQFLDGHASVRDAGLPFGTLLRRSKSIGLCLVDAQGAITDANDFFFRLIGRSAKTSFPIPVSACLTLDLNAARHPQSEHLSGCFAGHINPNDGPPLPVNIEIFSISGGGEQAWLILPKEAPFCITSPVTGGAGDPLPAQLFDCLHGGVAQSIAALAMNLHLVSQSHDVPDSANARQLLVSSITLVEQCSREVRSLTRLLRPGSPLSTSSCA
jgi:hypothetical protein